MMFVFEAVNTGAFVLGDVSTKAQLPFDEYIVVAGRIQCCAQQLTCLGGRVKHDGKRRLLVVPLPQIQDIEIPSVQVLGVGQVAVNFVQDVRACFPTLARKNLMADDDNSDSDEEEGDDAYDKHKLEETFKNEVQAQASKALEYMDQIQATTFTTLSEFFRAFQIADSIKVQSLLQNDPSMPEHYQLLCMDCSPSGSADDKARVVNPPPFSPSAPPKPFNFGVLFSEMASTKAKEQFLHIPVPRSPQQPATSAQGEKEAYVQETFQDATVLTFGTKRVESVYGGGKTCDEMIKNIRMRHASGTFCTLVLPSKTWGQVIEQHKAFLPKVCELQGQLRLRRLMGNAPREALPVKILLE